MSLRDYQREAIASLHRYIREDQRRLLISLPTGTGKTTVFANFVQELDLPSGEIALCVAHSDPLISQAAKSFREWVPNAWVDVEKSGAYASPFAKIVVGSIQTLRGKRLAEFMQRFRGKIRALIIDEAHRAPSVSYRNLIDAIVKDRPDAIILGVTATPKRRDNVGLGSIFSHIAYSMTMEQAINRGYLCPLHAYRIESDVSLDDVAVLSSGDFNKADLARVINDRVRNQQMVDAYLDLAMNKKAIVFVGSVEQAREVAPIFSAAGIPAEASFGELPLEEQRAIVERFRRGTTRVLTNFGMYLEGFDVADTEVVVQGRPTKSGTVYAQATGRVTRPHQSVAALLGDAGSDEERRALIANSPKPHAIVIDVVDNTRRHTLQSLPSLFGLPPNFNLAGKSATDAASTYRELSAIDPAFASLQLDLSKIEMRLREVDIFAVPTIPPEIGASAHLAWFEVERGCRYAITLPTLTIAQTTDGSKIADLNWVLSPLMARIRREIPAANPRPIALDRLKVDPATIKAIDVSFEVAENALGQFEMVRRANESVRSIGTRESLAEAIGECERLIREHYPHALRALAIDAAWKHEPIKPKQATLLRKLGTPEKLIPKTRGEASRLIDKLQHGKRAADRMAKSA